MTETTTRLIELARLFGKLGVIGFGGPAAHIAMMRREAVVRRGWLTEEHFLDLVGATNLIPGPSSTEMAIHIGRERAGWNGLLVAGSAFIIPAMLIVLACAWIYVRFEEAPAVTGLLYGIDPVVVAIIVHAWAFAVRRACVPFSGEVSQSAKPVAAAITETAAPPTIVNVAAR